MSKIKWKAGTFEYPIPAVMVSCGDMEKSNIITVAWTGIINTNPAMVYISVRQSRYSYNIIKIYLNIFKVGKVAELWLSLYKISSNG